ncbi:hypothetical protein B0H16DRAFT_461711 [Mycena metata]|uniref:RING-type domain-containing protein n=1 Tax=Mycena metata TaxID=1033252 RepID=A0AAD7HAW8_9AGAR|nr:hypothetical protein B0H16DRAFT_461711 [Mycena metata]
MTARKSLEAAESACLRCSWESLPRRPILSITAHRCRPCRTCLPAVRNKSEKIMLEIDSTSSAVKPQQDPDAAIQGSHDEQNDISHLYWSSYKHRVPDEALNKADSVSPTDPALSAAEEPFGELKPLTRKLGSVSLPEDEKDKKVSGLLPTLHSADSNPLSTRHDLLQQYPDTGLPYASPPHNPGYPPPHASHTHNPRYPPSSYNAGPPTSRLLGLLGPSHRPPEDELAAQLQGLELIGYRQRRPSIPALYSAYSNPLPTRHNSLQQYPDRSNPAERTNPRHPRGPPPSGHNPPSSRASWHAPDGPSWVPQQQPYPPPANTPQWSAPPPGSQPLRSMSMNPPTTSPSHRYGQSPPQTYPINQPPPPGSQPLRSMSMNPPTTSPSHRYGQSPPQTYPINQPPPPGSQPLHSMSMSQPPMASPSHRHAQLPPQAYPMNKSPGHPPSSYNAGPPTSRLPGPGHRPPEDELAAQLRLTAERAALQKDVQPIFECGVCFDKYPEDYVSRVADCSHEFCRDCMKGYVISKLKDKLYPIFCPMCVTDNARAEPGSELIPFYPSPLTTWPHSGNGRSSPDARPRRQRVSNASGAPDSLPLYSAALSEMQTICIRRPPGI